MSDVFASSNNFTDDGFTTSATSRDANAGDHEPIPTALIAIFMVGLAIAFFTVTSLVMILVVVKKCYLDDIAKRKEEKTEVNSRDNPPSYDDIIAIDLQNEFPPTYKEAKKLAKKR